MEIHSSERIKRLFIKHNSGNGNCAYSHAVNLRIHMYLI
jgi:hypothetical protein